MPDDRIGERLRILLEINHATMPALARHCQVHYQSVYNWVMCVSEPRTKNKKAIAEFFKITPQELEFAPILSLTRVVPQEKLLESMDVAMVRHAAELMLNKELAALPPRSQEFKDGLLDALIHAISGLNPSCPFELGTCQADAYGAGVLFLKTSKTLHRVPK